MSNMTLSMSPGRSVSVPNRCRVSSEELRTLLTLSLVADIPVGLMIACQSQPATGETIEERG